MDSREQSVHQTLHTIDPELAGLFARGCELFAQIEELGVASIMGHIGRELSIAVLEVVAREVDYPIVAGDSSTLEGSERFREAIARVVELPADDPRIDSMLHALGERSREVISRALMLRVDHPLVTSWLLVQRSLVAVTHYRRGQTTPTDRAREAWLALLGILHNRVRPYFDAQNELDGLLKIVSPGADDLNQLKSHLVRPQLRFRFYRSLTDAAWLAPLKQAGFFDYPPE